MMSIGLHPVPEQLELSTFSIVARDEATGMLGVAVSTAVPGVGALCPFAKAALGAVATQAFVNGVPGHRRHPPARAGPIRAGRVRETGRGRPRLGSQAVVDCGRGRKGSEPLGADCTPWFGHLVGDGVAVAGNMLVGGETIAAMLDAYEAASDADLAERLMQALEAGQVAGGDFRGRQSAALKVVRDQEFALCDLRVDEHPEPVAELRRVLDVARKQLLPFVESLPTRQAPGGSPPPQVHELLLRPPAER